MKIIVLCFFVTFAINALFLVNMAFVRKWHKRFSLRHAWKAEKLERNLQCLRRYAFHHILNIFLLSAGIFPMGIAVWLSYNASEWLLTAVASGFVFGNIFGVAVVVSSLNDTRRIRGYMKKGQKTELQLRKWFDDLKLIMEKFKFQLNHRLQ